MQTKPAVAVLGGGAWGTVLATVAARHGHEVALWEIDRAAADALARDRTSGRSVAHFRLPAEVAVSSDIGTTIAGRAMLVVAVPSAFVAATMQAVASARPPSAAAPSPIVVCASKGLEPGTGATMAEVIAANLPGARVGVLSGPSFAAEVARGLPAALVVASAEPEVDTDVQACFGGERIRIYTSNDVTGVCLGGALKNVVAIAAGISDGLSLGRNARAALVTRGLAEIARLVVAKGARTETFNGLTGLGDLVLTCTGDLSRNREVGVRLASGARLDTILAELGHVAEGVHSARAAREHARGRGVEMPITEAICAVLFEGRPATEAVQQLLMRDPRRE